MNKSNEEIKNGLYLIIKQKEYLTQNEFSVSEIWSETSKGKKDFYITEMGLLSKNVLSENDYITILFEKMHNQPDQMFLKEFVNNHSRTYALCVSMLNELTDNNVLYGFNLDSTEIKERVNDLKDKR